MSKIIMMDAWHPALNPSSRMPIHHLRYKELFGDYEGILNEFPRKNGGNIIRNVSLDDNSNLLVTELTIPVKWMPWWLPSNSKKACDVISTIYLEAIENAKKASQKDSYKEALNRYFKLMNEKDTMGEIVYRLNNDMFNEICPIYAPSLVSFTKSKLNQKYYNSFLNLKNCFDKVLNEYMEKQNKYLINPLLIYFDNEFNSYAVKYSKDTQKYVSYNIDNSKDSKEIKLNEILELFKEKRVIPSSLLSLILEVNMCKNGDDIVHFGNTYNKISIIEEVLKPSKHIEYFEDDSDSWNYANLVDTNNKEYPIHLHDIYHVKEKVTDDIKIVIEKSLTCKKTILINVQKGDKLIESLFN